MRRVLSVILFVLGGYLLMTEQLVAWIDTGAGIWLQLWMIGWFLFLAAIPLALGAWASPGNRLADLGMTLMISAAVAAACGIVVLMAITDPAVRKMMPPDQPMPDIAIDPLVGAINLLLIAGGGFALWRRGRARRKDRQAELESIFGD